MRQQLESLADELLKIGAIKFGEFTLKDGSTSPVYVDLRVLPSHPTALGLVAARLGEILRELEFDWVVGLPYAGIPLAVAVAMSEGMSAIMLRKEQHGSGTQKMIDGNHAPGDTVVVLDDVITTGDSKLEAAKPLTAAGLSFCDIVILVDREQGGQECVEAAGYTLHSVFTLRKLIEYYGETNQIDAETRDAVQGYLSA